MKIMFFFNWEFTRLCHALASELVKKYPHAVFSGVMVQKKELHILENQTEVAYGPILKLEDVFNEYSSETIDLDLLTSLRKKYGNPFLSEMLWADRDLTPPFAKTSYSQNDYQKITQVFFRHFEKYLDEVKPTYLIMDCIASLPAFVLYSIAKSKGVQIICFTYSRIEDRVYFVDNPYDKPMLVLKRFEEFKTLETLPEKPYALALEALERFRTKNIRPKYLEGLSHSEKEIFSWGRNISRFAQYFMDYYGEAYSKDYTFKGKDPFTRLIDKSKQVLRNHIPSNNLFEHPQPHEKYLFFPLHADPEIATLVMGFPFVNQIELVRIIAKCIPLTHTLYVKDHPLMHTRALRDKSYYEELKKIPNVRLIHPGVSSLELIKKSDAVLTITGTAGFEALLLKKPVIVFGNCCYSDLSSVLKGSDLLKLRETIQTALTDPHYNEKEIHTFLAALYAESIPCDLFMLMGYAHSSITVTAIKQLPDFKRLVNFLDATYFSKKKGVA